MKHIIYSEILKKQFDTEKECLAEEKKFLDAKAAKEKQDKKVQEARKSRAEEVSKAFEEYREAEKRYIELRNSFIKDYGSYHVSFTDIEFAPRGRCWAR